jgi:hypothetical protein
MERGAEAGLVFFAPGLTLLQIDRVCSLTVCFCLLPRRFLIRCVFSLQKLI